jgi:hypothetical protein
MDNDDWDDDDEYEDDNEYELLDDSEDDGDETLEDLMLRPLMRLATEAIAEAIVEKDRRATEILNELWDSSAAGRVHVVHLESHAITGAAVGESTDNQARCPATHYGDGSACPLCKGSGWVDAIG